MFPWFNPSTAWLDFFDTFVKGCTLGFGKASGNLILLKSGLLSDSKGFEGMCNSGRSTETDGQAILGLSASNTGTWLLESEQGFALTKRGPGPNGLLKGT